MTPTDKEYLEHLYTGFALAGLLANGKYLPEEVPSLSKDLGHRMMEEEKGIISIKPLRRKK